MLSDALWLPIPIRLVLWGVAITMMVVPALILEHRYLAPRITRWRHKRHDPWARLERGS